MKSRYLQALVVGLGMTSAASFAQAATYDVIFTGTDSLGTVTANMILNVTGGNVVSGTGTITTGQSGTQGWGTASMTFLSSPTLATVYEFNGGTELFNDDNAFPIDGYGLAFNVGTPAKVGQYQTGGGFGIWLVGGNTYQAGLFDFVNGGHEWEEVNGTVNVSTVPLPAALPMMAAALVGLGAIGLRRKDKIS